jgi:hypothetical protein
VLDVAGRLPGLSLTPVFTDFETAHISAHQHFQNFVPAADRSQITPAPARANTGRNCRQPHSTQTPITPPLCDGPPVMTILALGIDTSKDPYRSGWQMPPASCGLI